ncbi:uncharacterized protein EI97DRAFT_228226 [Westerdykella ornata]|uniref:Smr domain-containing protein n=1 Tax=Westerdykella ornata TaxID=318751 RepID=A0A6A6JRW9_WESOR|nr:uncharacterized protein EI97DRAFT_228226 [Westerdykella ornata]KAF2279137.1 hypothetical protein EI97DRAFT_228226 [Westerdykella ornata]
MDEDLQLLEQEYCPVIDPTVVYAIYSDFAGTDDALQSARELLDGLKQAALVQQQTDFDPSGSSGDGGAIIANSSSRTGSNDTEDWTSTAEEGVSQTTDESREGGVYFRQTESYDAADKEALLAETFPGVRRDLVKHILRKCGEDLSRATDELLNHVFLAEAETVSAEELVVPKGIDAFFEEHHVPTRSRKGRKKKNRRDNGKIHTASASESDVPSSPTNNPWSNGNSQIELIASCTNMSTAAISSLYHRNGASIPATIGALIDENLASNRSTEQPEPGLIQDAIALVETFPSIELEHAVALLRLTSPSTPNAHELAKALLTPSSSKSSTYINRTIIPHYAPLRLTDTIPTTSLSKENLPPLAPSLSPYTTSSLSIARSAAFTQASSLHRKGKSSPLMKSAAAYYAQLGRDLSLHLRAASAADADALVASQWVPGQMLDLHGVSVADAVRIAETKAAEWWEGLGEERVPGGGRRGVGDGYRIVVGLGRHSEGGRGKLGPAVVRALVKRGWKVEVGTGEVRVIGRGRR